MLSGRARRLAAKRLSADTINIASSSSSLTKGETILDMAKNIEAMNVDLIVARHSSAGVPKILSEHLTSSVVNAGDGCREHPTQALLDLFTLFLRRSVCVDCVPVTGSCHRTQWKE